MATAKTRPNGHRVSDFIKAVQDPGQRRDARTIMKIMRDATGRRATMWGSSIIGFDSYSYTTDGGHSGQWMLTGLSPRKREISVYIMNGFSRYGVLMKKLGKYRTGKSCLYIKCLDDVDVQILEQLIQRSVRDMRKTWPNR